jgi:hypothetical protein
MTNFGLRNRESGTVSATNTSVGTWKKLERIRANPHVALAYHTREHGFSDRPEYVLVQGKASLSAPHPDYPGSIRESWERFGGPRDVGPFWEWWLRVWHLRIEIEVAVERLIVWPDRDCHGALEVHGSPLPAQPPEPQPAPGRGVGPRVDHARAAKRAASLPNVLLGWVGSDGFPMVVPVDVWRKAEARGIVLEVPEGVVPAGGRRAGLTAHWFSDHVVGQNLRKHTGWLEAEPASRRVVYAPHTEAGYRLPPSRFLFKLAAGFATRWGLRGARRAGILASGSLPSGRDRT